MTFVFTKTIIQTIITGAVGDSGASDAGIMVTNGVPCLDGVGVVGDGAHTDQEFAKVSSMIERASLLAEFIRAQE